MFSGSGGRQENRKGAIMINEQILRMGETAGMIWGILAEHGPTSVAGLVKRLGVSRDLVMEGIGWLGREGKITVADEGRSRIVALVES